MLRCVVVVQLLCLPAFARAANTGKFEIQVVDAATGEVIPCRMHLKSPNGKPRKVPRQPFWKDHFAFPGTLELELPRGTYTFELERGPEYSMLSGHFTIERDSDDSRT